MKTFVLKPFQPLALDLSALVLQSTHGEFSIFNFTITGDIQQIVWPQLNSEAVRELWRHSCFEIFEYSLTDERYSEWNVSHHKEVELYHFESYRKRLSAESQVPLEMQFQKSNDTLHCKIEVPHFYVSSHWQPTLILDLKGFDQSFWAHQHPSDKADFHRKWV